MAAKPPRAADGKLLPGARLNPFGYNQDVGRPIENWRSWLRRETNNGAEIHQILLSLARGEPRTVTRKDGATTTIIPTAEVSARVAIHLDEMLHGKAVTQNEQQAAEREASALQAVRALSYEELARRAAQALQRGIAEEDAQLVLPSGSPGTLDRLWNCEGGLTLPLEDD